MFVTELGLFSIGTIDVLTLVWLNIFVKLITSAGLNLVEWVYVPIEPIFILPILFDMHVKSNIYITCFDNYTP
jgi:hypothetical protein